MTVGERIKKVRLDTLNMSQVDLAKTIGVSKQTLYKYENNIITNIPTDKIEAIARLAGVSPSYLMGWKTDHKTTDLSRFPGVSVPAAYGIPIFGEICCGNGVFAEDNYRGLFFIDQSVKADGCLIVRGDSMIDAGIQDGDIAFLKKDFDFEDGHIYAVLITGENLLSLKKVYMKRQALLLCPCNPAYEPQLVGPDEASIVAECCGFYHEIGEGGLTFSFQKAGHEE